MQRGVCLACRLARSSPRSRPSSESEAFGRSLFHSSAACAALGKPPEDDTPNSKSTSFSLPLINKAVMRRQKEQDSQTQTTPENETDKIEEAEGQSSFGYLRQLLGSALLMGSRKEQPKQDTAAKASAPTNTKTKQSATPTKTELAARARAAAANQQQVLNRTFDLIALLRTAETDNGRLMLIEDLATHLTRHPETVAFAAEHDVYGLLLRMVSSTQNEQLRANCQMCLALVGYITAPKGRGLNILSMDGGGTRGMLSLEVLEALEQELGGRRLHECFDLMVGVSTGAMMCSLLGAFQLSVAETREIYRDISVRLFAQTKLSGVSGLLWSHSYYSTQEWIKLLKSILGDQPLIHSSKKPGAPKLAFVSCVVNTAKLEPFIFRNFNHSPARHSPYAGSCKYATWQALQASAAAPGYFEEVALDHLLHQDGGVLVNNPTAIALNEARALWPDAPIQTVLSIGNGRSMLAMPTVPDERMQRLPTSTSLAEKIVKIVDSATDTELVHQAMSCLLSPKCYYRISPYISHSYTLDEIDPDRLSQMEADAHMYIRRNVPKIKQVASTLLQERSRLQKLTDQTRLSFLTRFGQEPSWLQY